MNQDSLTHACNRQDELISVLYGEASTEDTRKFRSHLEQCVSCNEQYEAFSGVRTSVREFRDQILVGVQASLSKKIEPKSARAALKAFFALSPAWMKLGTAFASALLCVFAFIAFIAKTGPTVPPSAFVDSTKAGAKVYSESELKDAVAKAVNEATGASPRHDVEVRPTPNEVTADHSGINLSPSPTPKSRRPLSRNERQQLAADLRLITRPDDDGLELLSDRINQ